MTIYAKCDGNHGGPRCRDPECWNDSPDTPTHMPSWATGISGVPVVGSQLSTRDGRRMGNAVITAVDDSHPVGTIYTCVTDAGNALMMTEEGLSTRFYPPRYVMDPATHPGVCREPIVAAQGEPAAFQHRVQPWMMACFGAEIAGDKHERNHRFLEEALELVQACGCTASEAHQLVDYTFGRPVGEPQQEVGGVMVTLAALCLANGLDMHEAGEIELARIWTKVEAIRAKQASKPKHSPLPQHTAPRPSGDSHD